MRSFIEMLRRYSEAEIIIFTNFTVYKQRLPKLEELFAFFNKR